MCSLRTVAVEKRLNRTCHVLLSNSRSLQLISTFLYIARHSPSYTDNDCILNSNTVILFSLSLSFTIY